jgi:hypothetical protein
VEQLLRKIDSLGLALRYRRALDFGCGGKIDPASFGSIRQSRWDKHFVKDDRTG